MDLVSIVMWSLIIGGVAAAFFIVRSYAKGLKECPRDMWFLFIYKVIEYTAYAAMNMTFILWLSRDCGLGDIAAGSYISGWSIMLSVIAMVAGALVDTIGIKKTLLISVVFLLISRFFMAFITDPVFAFILGFMPLAIGFGIVGPVVSVAIKKYTTKEGAALGFGLFYVVMNMAYAVGGWFFDFVRDKYALRDAAGKILNENAGTAILGHHFTTYQMFFLFGFIFTSVSMFFVFFLREGIELNDDGKVVEVPMKKRGSGIEAVKSAAVDTVGTIRNVMKEKYFWIFLGMLSLTLFVRFIFFHMHYTFPKYGIRVLGEGAKIGSVYGVLNPVLIIYLVPLIAYFTKKTSSYKMMIIGSLISAGSCFIPMIPVSVFSGLTDSMLGELVLVKWLGIADSMPELLKFVESSPNVYEYWPMMVFFLVFTVGEAIWSPRLMQFTAEIAPKGKEGTYIALSVLPWFAAKFVVGPMSGILVDTYVPLSESGEIMSSYPGHAMVWVWIGAMALLTPIGLLVFRNLFTHKIDATEEAV